MLYPRFKVGDEVLRSGVGRLIFVGTVRKVIKPCELPILISEIAEEDEEKMVSIVREMYERDKEFHENYSYLVEPKSSPGPATFEEAKYIIPDLTETQYLLLMKGRRYLVLDSDLMDSF